ncbi:MAG: hypothetical protein JNL47_06340 [Bacteroidia bacterium]|nr:hypothetical protein [Bacteroidia bacterium]
MKILLASALLLVFTSMLQAQNKKAKQLPQVKNKPQPAAAGCAASVAAAELDINNVRAMVLAGGDMWWDLATAQYEIPKGSGKTSIFNGAIWIAGIDGNGQIKAAAQTYRQQAGNDFWTGPIDTANLTISTERCIKFDLHFKITRKEVKEFSSAGNYSDAPEIIRTWPGNGNYTSGNEARYLAPFIDTDLDGIYDYTKGDYPGYSLNGDYPFSIVTGTDFKKFHCNHYLFGDQTLWWVFNDVGNNKTETDSDPIGLEIRAQAFAFKAPDEINDMTFYQFQIINRSTLAFNDVYFCQWTDPDLGKYDDDYVGCDVPRGLGYCYNGDNDDEGIAGYGLIPPAVGIDFLQGTDAITGNLRDDDFDGCADCTFIVNANGDTVVIADTDLPERNGLTKFKFYEGSFSVTGNPQSLIQYFYYTRGLWLDGSPQTYGGNGSGGQYPCDYMFPGKTDPIYYPLLGEWSEPNAGNAAGDRRFIPSTGPFHMAPGSVHYITTGVIWARADSGNQYSSLQKLLYADDKAQALFNNCFQTIEGPDAPDLAIRELNKEIIISLENTFDSRTELYRQKDPTIVSVNGQPVPDSLKYFVFEGYQVFQLKDASVTIAELKNPDRARFVMQCDIKNGVSKLVNHYYNSEIGAAVPAEEANGKDAGIVHTLRLTKDMFASGANDLVNHKTYYFMAISYAYNNFSPFNPFHPDSLQGQRTPYKAGINNVKVYSAIPHPYQPEAAGLIVNSSYGNGPRIQRIEGQGNGGNVIDLTDESIAEILQNNIAYNPVYKPAYGPVGVKVYDPVMVSDGRFEIRLNGVDDNSAWSMKELNSSITANADYTLGYANEQLMKGADFSWGLSVKINNVIEAGKPGAVNNAFLEATIQYSDNAQRWLTGVKDVDGVSPENWIRSGINVVSPSNPQGDYPGIDDEQVYEKVLDGIWAPFKLAAIANPAEPHFPRTSVIASAIPIIQLSPTANSKTGIASVDIVITPDKSKWSRAAVIEIGADQSRTIGNSRQFDLRKSPSIDKDGNPGGDLSVLPFGMGWFPGYAINVETGERMNIAYGENSMMAHQNGTDMKWNPTAQKYKNNNPADSVFFGGMHYIYVFGHHGDNVSGKTDVPAYDQCEFIATMLDLAATTNNNTIRRNVWKDCQWVNLPLLATGKQVLSSEVKIRLRVARTYRPLAGNAVINNNQPLTSGTTYYVCSTPVTYGIVTYNTVGNTFIAGNDPLFTGSGLVTAIQPENNFMPYYRFSTNELSAKTNDVETAKNALDLINIVPNPYYAYSAYENTDNDFRVKITNLPPKCTVSIFNLSGTLIRKYYRNAALNNTAGTETAIENSSTGIDWDLKNHSGTLVSSGIYLIHIKASGLGERTMKWFGMLRPVEETE